MNKQELRTPHHGNGGLKSGNPGNRGGGRRPCAIKALCRTNFSEALEVAVKIAAGEKLTENEKPPSYGDMLRAINLFGRYGFAEAETILPADLAHAVGRIMRDYLPPDRVTKAVEALVESLEQCQPTD